MKPVGWRGHPREHALAARGISTKYREQELLKAEGVIRDIVEFPEGIEVDYEVPRHVFTLFWVSSLNHDFSNFDFERAFDQAEQKMYNKLYDHALISPEATLEYLESMIIHRKPLSYSDVSETALFRKWCTFLDGPEALARVVGEEEAAWLAEYPYEPMRRETALLLAGDTHEAAKKAFLVEEPYAKMVETYAMLRDRPSGLQERVALMDRVVDTYHIGGSIWDVDIDRMRKQVMNIYARYGRNA